MGKHKSRQIDQNRRREQFVSDRSRRRRRFSWNWVLMLGGLGFLIALLYVSASAPPSAESRGLQQAEMVPTGQDVRLPAASFADGRTHFYRYTTAAGRDIRFFVLRSSDGVVRAAYDACDVCYLERKGYHQAGDNMVCNNCGRTFRSVDVNVVTGGCNPAALERTMVADQVLITRTAIERGVSYF